MGKITEDKYLIIFIFTIIKLLQKFTFLFNRLNRNLTMKYKNVITYAAYI